MSHKGHTFRQKRSIDEIRDDHVIDDRWTESKLLAAGYEHRGDNNCKTCGDRVSFYKRERASDYKGKAVWLVLNEGVLDPHQCRGGRR